MRRDERGILKVMAGIAALVALAPLVFVAGLLVLGTSVAPALPAPRGAPLPPLLKDAIWARAEGGRATSLRPIGPALIVELLACTATAPGGSDAERVAACRHVLPGLPAVEYLSTILLRDHGVNRQSFRGGAGALVTTVRATRSWTREEFLQILAERADFGYGWRGVDAASRGFFDRPTAALTLPQAALLASRLGDPSDPWCEPDAAAGLRHRVLMRMHDNGVVSDADLQRATTAELGLAHPPQGRPRCGR